MKATQSLVFNTNCFPLESCNIIGCTHFAFDSYTKICQNSIIDALGVFRFLLFQFSNIRCSLICFSYIFRVIMKNKNTQIIPQGKTTVSWATETLTTMVMITLSWIKNTFRWEMGALAAGTRAAMNFLKFVTPPRYDFFNSSLKIPQVKLALMKIVAE